MHLTPITSNLKRVPSTCGCQGCYYEHEEICPATNIIKKYRDMDIKEKEKHYSEWPCNEGGWASIYRRIRDE